MDENEERRRKSPTSEERTRECDHPTPEHPARATDQPAPPGARGPRRRRVLSAVDAETWTRSLRAQQAEQQRKRRHTTELIGRPALDGTNEKDH